MTNNSRTTGPFHSLGEQAQATIRAIQGRVPDARLDQVTRAALGANEKVGSDAGFLVQSDFALNLWERAYSTGELLSKCTRIPISSKSNEVVLPGLDETSRVEGSRS